jgi:NADH-quinone oxidoreductase subunit N
VMSYMAIYVVMTLGSFACVLQMRGADGNPIETISGLSGLSQTRKGLAAALAIFMFSLAGIPPLFGFWAKFLVFDAAVAAGLLPLAALGIASSVIGAFYYLKIIQTMYFDAPVDEIAPSDGWLERAVMIISAAVIVGGYLAIPLLSSAAGAAAKALF